MRALPTGLAGADAQMRFADAAIGLGASLRCSVAVDVTDECRSVWAGAPGPGRQAVARARPRHQSHPGDVSAGADKRHLARETGDRGMLATPSPPSLWSDCAHGRIHLRWGHHAGDLSEYGLALGPQELAPNSWVSDAKRLVCASATEAEEVAVNTHTHIHTVARDSRLKRCAVTGDASASRFSAVSMCTRRGDVAARGVAAGMSTRGRGAASFGGGAVWGGECDAPADRPRHTTLVTHSSPSPPTLSIASHG
jgi:hypothetical protein